MFNVSNALIPNISQKVVLSLTGSSMKPCTPDSLPKEITIMVALPYKAYPAHTNFLPGFKASASVGGPAVSYRKYGHSDFLILSIKYQLYVPSSAALRKGFDLNALKLHAESDNMYSPLDSSIFIVTYFPSCATHASCEG